MNEKIQEKLNEYGLENIEDFKLKFYTMNLKMGAQSRKSNTKFIRKLFKIGIDFNRKL